MRPRTLPMTLLAVVAVGLLAIPAAAEPGPTMPTAAWRLVPQWVDASEGLSHALTIPATTVTPSVPWSPSTPYSLAPPSGLVGDAQVTVDGLVFGWRPLIIAIDGATGELSVVQGDTPLTDDALAALDLAPTWLRDELVLSLALCDASTQDALAGVMLGEDDPRLLDEEAFLLAHLPHLNLTDPAFDPALVSDNAAAIYEAAETFSFVELVERGEASEGGDYGTTVTLLVGPPSSTEWYEVPEEAYYWYVVHPRLDQELVLPIDPLSGEPSADGLFWRSYFPAPEDDAITYVDHFVMTAAGPLAEEDLQGWGPSARGSYDDLSFGPLELVTGMDGAVYMMELRVGKGTILATQLRVEGSQTAGATSLLEAMVAYGPGNVTMAAGAPYLVITDTPLAADDPLSLALDAHYAYYQVVSSSELADTDLSTYFKIIVAEGQPAATYQAVAALREPLEEWLAGGRIFELHGYVEAEDDWGGAVMPGGFTVSGASSDGTDDLVMGGQPAYLTSVQGSTTVWDLVPYDGLSGDRPLAPDAMALDALGWWVSQNMFDNVSEYYEKHGPSAGPRSIQPVRIAQAHFGNCGELQDMLGAAAKTALLPIRNVSDSPEDHVWNQVLIGGDWVSYQVDWSDGPTRIDNPGVSYEKLHGGGKDISAVIAHRGDGFVESVTGDYSETVELQVAVVDDEGAPVDGALVIVATEQYYEEGGSYPLTIAYWGYTSLEGLMSVSVGDAQNYYVQVSSPAGSFPAGGSGVSLVASVEETVPGAELPVTITLDGHLSLSAPMSQPPAPLATPPMDEPSVGIAIDPSGLVLQGIELATGGPLRLPTDQGVEAIPYLVLDQAGLEAYEAGTPFEAQYGGEATSGTVVWLPHPGDETRYLVVGLIPQVGHGALASVTAGLFSPQPPAAEPLPEVVDETTTPSLDSIDETGHDTTTVEDDTDDHTSKGEDGGCATTRGGASPVGLGLLLTLWLLVPVVLRRSRILAILLRD